MRFFKVIKKIFSWVFWILIVILVSGSISLYLYKDRIINHVISEANKYINTPIDVDHIGLNVWDKFPNVSITFNNISIQESWSGSKDPLMNAERVFILLNPLDLALGNLEIQQIHIENAQFYIKLNREGVPNYKILKSIGGTSNDSLRLNLSKVTLSNTAVTYLDFRRNQEHKYFTASQVAKISIQENLYNISTSGDVDVRSIKIEGKEYVHEQHVTNSIRMVIDASKNQLTIISSELGLTKSKFRTTGLISLDSPNSITLEIEGVDTNIQTLISLLPGKSARKFIAYKSVGDVYFNMDLKGTLGQIIQAKADFGMRNATITHPETGIIFENVNLEGSLNLPNITHPESLALELQTVKGSVSDQKFSGKLSYSGISSPHLTFDLDGTILMEDLVKLIDHQKLVRGSGLISGHVSFSGNTNDIKSLRTINRVKAEGSLALENVVMEFLHDYPPKTTVTGGFSYKENNLTVDQATITMGTSEWEMTGLFKNLLPYLVSRDQDLRIEATISRGNLVLDEFLQPSGQPEEFRYTISDKLNLDVTANLDRLTLRRFSASEINGRIKINNQMAFIKNLTFKSMGGSLRFNSLINTKEDLIRINNTIHLEGINIDSVFYVYHNFGQNWLKADNLKGKVYADVFTDMVFSQNLKFYPDSLISDISIAIIDGELNNFEPMRKLENYVGGEDLSNLKFSELQNDIHIEDRTIFIPNMEVRSNISNLLISGTHTFDQQIEYHVVVPFKSLRNKNEDMFGAVEDDGSGSKLHLIIAGTTQDYEIVYDTKAVGKKIISDLKKEVNELKNAFKKKERTTEEITLNEDEYFEWDEDTTSIKRN